MKNRIKITILVLFLVAPLICFAEGNQSMQPEPLKDAYIKYKQVGWQTYEFDVLTNLLEPKGLVYEWTVDKTEIFRESKLRYFFSIGTHVIQVRTTDNFGNKKSDSVEINVRFWSLKNNWFWWALYLIIILIIFYYWAAKIIYLFNRRRVSREARYFLDLLDEHGWVERIIKVKMRNKK